MKFKKKLLALTVLLFAVSLFGCHASAPAETEERQPGLCGVWEGELVADVGDLTSGTHSETDGSIRLTLRDDGSGLWELSFSDDHPTSSRAFSYELDAGELRLAFEDGKQEGYAFSLAGDTLTLEGKIASYTLTCVP